MTGVRRRFDPGVVVATPGALVMLAHHSKEPGEYVARHLSGDWGDLGAFDRRENGRALRTGARLLSSYAVGGEKVWIITEADRSSTCLLLPSEY
jgi:hypothetical protein